MVLKAGFFPPGAPPDKCFAPFSVGNCFMPAPIALPSRAQSPPRTGSGHSRECGVPRHPYPQTRTPLRPHAPSHPIPARPRGPHDAYSHSRTFCLSLPLRSLSATHLPFCFFVSCSPLGRLFPWVLLLCGSFSYRLAVLLLAVNPNLGVNLHRCRPCPPGAGINNRGTHKLRQLLFSFSLATSLFGYCCLPL